MILPLICLWWKGFYVLGTLFCSVSLFFFNLWHTGMFVFKNCSILSFSGGLWYIISSCHETFIFAVLEFEHWGKLYWGQGDGPFVIIFSPEFININCSSLGTYVLVYLRLRVFLLLSSQRLDDYKISCTVGSTRTISFFKCNRSYNIVKPLHTTILFIFFVYKVYLVHLLYIYRFSIIVCSIFLLTFHILEIVVG